MEGKRTKAKYSPTLPGRMYRYFISYEEGGVPSFTKFAKSIGATTEDVESFRKKGQFDRAYRECQQIRRDYLIDRALERRFDPSFVKFLLTEESEAADSQESGEFTLHLEVTE